MEALYDVHLLDVVVVVLAIYVFWDKVGTRIWGTMRGVVHEMDDRDALKEIADAIGPLNGRNLMQRLEELEASTLRRDARLEAIEARQATMENKIDVFLVAQMRGGRRFYDPHDDPEVGGGE